MRITKELKSYRAIELKRAFTLIETILVMATFAIMFVISVPLYQSFQVRNDLLVTVDIFTQSLSRAQTLAMHMEENSNWGVYIETSSTPYKIQNITLFKASNASDVPSDFAGRETGFDEVFTTSTSIQTGADDPEFAFTKFTGELTVASATSVCFTAPQIGTTEKLVTINEKGKITITDDCP